MPTFLWYLNDFYKTNIGIWQQITSIFAEDSLIYLRNQLSGGSRGTGFFSRISGKQQV